MTNIFRVLLAWDKILNFLCTKNEISFSRLFQQAQQNAYLPALQNTLSLRSARRISRFTLPVSAFKNHAFFVFLKCIELYRSLKIKLDVAYSFHSIKVCINIRCWNDWKSHFEVHTHRYRVRFIIEKSIKSPCQY